MNTYPTGTIRALLETAAVTAPTRAAIEQRLRPPEVSPLRFFSLSEMEILRAAAARLLAQPLAAETINLVREIDDRLVLDTGNGWRFASLPPDRETYRGGLAGLEESAIALHGSGFAELNGEQQDDVLRCVQAGSAPGKVWRTLDAPRFLEELLADLAEAYYSHPVAQEEIGYAGMADAPGWTGIGLNEMEEREPRAIAV